MNSIEIILNGLELLEIDEPSLEVGLEQQLISIEVAVTAQGPKGDPGEMVWSGTPNW